MSNTPTERQLRPRPNSNTAVGEVTLTDIKLLIESTAAKMMTSLEEKIDRLTTSLSTVLTRMDAIDKKYDDIERRCRKIEEEQLNVISEIEDRERRKQNLMICGIPEREDGTVDERRTWDKQKIESLFQDLGSFHSEVIASIHRMGKVNTRKPRLLKVVCRNVETKRFILSKAKNLRSLPGHENVYVNPDQTPLEQRQNRELREEYKRRKALNEDVTIRHGRMISKQNFH